MRAEWIFFEGRLICKEFWNHKFLAKHVSKKVEIHERTGTPILPGSALTVDTETSLTLVSSMSYF